MRLHTLHVPLMASATLRRLSWIGHVLAGLALMMMASRTPILWLVLPLGGAHALDLDRRLGRRREHDWVHLLWGVNDRVRWTTKSGAVGTGRCTAARVWGAAWLVLTIRPAGARYRSLHLVLPRDATPREIHRRMRVRARIAAPQRTERTDPAA